jgi:hypothetical protein
LWWCALGEGERGGHRLSSRRRSASRRRAGTRRLHGGKKGEGRKTAEDDSGSRELEEEEGEKGRTEGGTAERAEMAEMK